MSIELNGLKVWGTGYHRNGKLYGDSDWKEKIYSLIQNQDSVIVKGRYGKNTFDFHYNITGFPFSLMSKDRFLELLDKTTVDYTDDIYLYDAFENMNNIWSKKCAITEKNRYIFVSHTATDCQMF